MRFKKIYLEIINICNLNCSFCIGNQRPVKQMSVIQFKHIIQQIKPFTKHVYLHVLGEPFLHPLLPIFLDICKKEKILVNLTTNGTLLKQRINEIKDYSLRQLNISLHSYEAHHQENYLQDILSCVQALPDTYISYRLWCMKKGSMTKENMQMMEELFAYYHIEKPGSIQPGSSLALTDHEFLHLEEVFTWPSLENPYQSQTGSCRGFQDMCAILCDGSVVPCCLDSNGDMNYGNIFETNMKDIIYNEQTMQFCQKMKEHHLIEELCQKCQYRLRFDKRLL